MDCLDENYTLHMTTSTSQCLYYFLFSSSLSLPCYLYALYMYLIHTPNLGLEITVSIREGTRAALEEVGRK